MVRTRVGQRLYFSRGSGAAVCGGPVRLCGDGSCSLAGTHFLRAARVLRARRRRAAADLHPFCPPRARASQRRRPAPHPRRQEPAQHECLGPNSKELDLQARNRVRVSVVEFTVTTVFHIYIVCVCVSFACSIQSKEEVLYYTDRQRETQ